MQPHRNLPTFDRFTWIALLALAALLFGWLYYTPPGLLGKADAVGYAVCHRIEARSFLFGERQLPLCARCSGMYLGALTAIIIQFFHGRRSGFPPLKFLIVLGIFVIFFGIDGVNSYLHLFPNMPGIYEPNNFLRLLTGTGMGVGMGAILVPLLHQTYWSHCDPSPIIHEWRVFLPILAASLVVSGLLLTGNALLLYPLAILSAATVLLILGLIYSMVWMMLFKKDNTFRAWKEIFGYLAAGFALAIFQIFAIDIVRFYFTNSWNGFNFL
ncbi:MAG: DUF2085 domain-containing protein [Leptolinea sp.]